MELCCYLYALFFGGHILFGFGWYEALLSVDKVENDFI
jgi:hypothetical protein